MDSHIPSVFLTALATLFLSLLTTLPQSHSQQLHDSGNNHYADCTQPFSCGDAVSGIRYPFWGGNRSEFCGGGWDFKLYCDDEDGGQHASIQIGSQNFGVLHINNTNYTVRMSGEDRPGTDVCYTELTDMGNTALNHSLFFRYTDPEAVHNITIFRACPPGSSFGDGNTDNCPGDEHPIAFFEVVNDTLYREFPKLRDCKERIEVPLSKSVRLGPNGGNIDALNQALRARFEFEVNYTVRFGRECMGCVKSGGACGTNDTATFQFTCHCRDGSHHASLCPGHGLSRGAKLGIGVGVGAAALGVLTVSLAFYVYQHRKKTRDGISYTQPRSMSSDPSLKDTEFGSIIYGVHLFTYSELEEATNYFDPSRELGDGGFGTVYLGKLQDGCCVAVKRLYENNYRRVEQFKNEIKILTSLHHRNLVSLYGCSSRHSRELLLVYEYIPNGTVADHLHGERVKAGPLPWHIRMNIAVETAGALAYLHASEVIHRDVKTNNILLDNHFVVKVADFGLSRLFPTHLTHVSTVPQGTPGYVDPEYHECYQLTVKSDVYSFGVVLVELISSLPAVDITRHRHEINLSNMAINKIHNQALHELVDPNLGFESDYKVRKMINAVAELAFQCLQSSKDMRPSMEEVLDALRDIQSDGKYKSQPEVMDISTADDVVLLKDDPPPPSPDSNAVSKSTTPNASG